MHSVNKLRIGRRSLLGLFVAGGATAIAMPSGAIASASGRPRLAVTIDDFRSSEGDARAFAHRDRRIRNALGAHDIKVGAFPAGRHVEHDHVAQALSQWSREGHLIGNHSYSHRYFRGSDPSGMMEDVLRAERLLEDLPTFERMMRFPYLAEGTTREGRDGLRALLVQNGYRNAHVSIDASDWYVSDRLENRLENDPQADLSGYRRYYIDHLLSRARYYDDLAKTVGFTHDIAHVILVHHNEAAARFLEDALARFEAEGWELCDIAHAYLDPIYLYSPDSMPSGQSILWGLAQQYASDRVELRYPGEDGRYEEAAMDAAGL